MRYSKTLGLTCIATFYMSVCAKSVWTNNVQLDHRAEAIKNAFKHAWKGYSDYAYGHDELRPLTNGTTDSR